jgi:hypothetical protein
MVLLGDSFVDACMPKHSITAWLGDLFRVATIYDAASFAFEYSNNAFSSTPYLYLPLDDAVHRPLCWVAVSYFLEVVCPHRNSISLRISTPGLHAPTKNT